MVTIHKSAPSRTGFETRMERHMAKKKTTVSDQFYSKVLADTGSIVSGGAALLVRAKAMGGPTCMVDAAGRGQ
ncbi:hypothetical protein [Novosphingobium sp. TCA1]|uniref:hypothetical protein n=1 Tax=Novosphingobium sp. TCA1 TaxID=2682474 RepID=UPI00130CAA4A|nr:hypothetical protein [Novosphingobium sp. TCA1]GFE77719.1 hypothetical protein NTCA1_53680 [Novosphingobium sp. TCA1]